MNDFYFARWVVLKYGTDYLNSLSEKQWLDLYDTYRDDTGFKGTPATWEPPRSYREQDSNECNCGQPSCSFGCA